MDESQDITVKLQAWNEGNQKALEELSGVVYRRIRKLASRYLRHEEFQTMQSTDLVNQAFISLITGKLPKWENRAHFYGILARLMRQILIQSARRRSAKKRIGRDQWTDFEVERLLAPRRPSEFVRLDETLQVLESIDARQCRIVELRYFGGLSIEETAVALDCSASTVVREWRLAKAWLYRELSSGGSK